MFLAKSILGVVEGKGKIILPEDDEIRHARVNSGAYSGTARMLMARDTNENMAKHASVIANAMGCGNPGDNAKRVFRYAGIHEDKHIKANLDLWYDTDCAIDFFLAGEDELKTDNQRARIASTLVHEGLNRLEKFLEAPEFQNTAAALDSIHPVHRIEQSYATDDPKLDDQLAHYDAINLADAWDIGAGSREIVVQVLDTGLDFDHPEFVKNIWNNSDEICDNGVDDDNNGYIDDCNGYNHADDTGTELMGYSSHGTHCSGTIAADNDNALYGAGVAGGKGGAAGTSLMTSVAFGVEYFRGFAEALVYGADHGAHISSNSWSYVSPDYIDPAVELAIDYGVDEGVIFVFAAGNYNYDGCHHPACKDSTISVAALDNDGKRASFSNYGESIDISAPGVAIWSTVSVADGYFAAMSGTSMATPHVAGLLALGMAVGPERTVDETRECLTSTATDVDDINMEFAVGNLGAGMIHAYKFAACMYPWPTSSPTTAFPTSTPVPTRSCNCDLTVELSIITDSYPAEITWEFVAVNDTCAPQGMESQEGGSYEDGDTEFTETISNICSGMTYTFTIFDSWGDGMCCSYGEGSYELVSEGYVVASGGVFYSEESTTFTVVSAPSSAPTQDPTGCSVEYDYWIGDGFCDSSANSLECDWDGGDCCEETCVANGIKSSCGLNGFTCLDPMTSTPTFQRTDEPTPQPTHVPTTSAPTMTLVPTQGSCQDSSTWYKAKTWKHCAWVEENTASRCSMLGSDGTYAYESCLATCGCDTDAPIPIPTSVPTSSAPTVCADSSTWTRGSKSWKNCDWVSENTDSRCHVLGTDNIFYGYEACPVSCGTCG